MSEAGEYRQRSFRASKVCGSSDSHKLSHDISISVCTNSTAVGRLVSHTHTLMHETLMQFHLVVTGNSAVVAIPLMIKHRFVMCFIMTCAFLGDFCGVLTQSFTISVASEREQSLH